MQVVYGVLAFFSIATILAFLVNIKVVCNEEIRKQLSLSFLSFTVSLIVIYLGLISCNFTILAFMPTSELTQTFSQYVTYYGADTAFMLILWMFVSATLPDNKTRTVLSLVNLIEIVVMYVILSYFLVENTKF